MGPTAQIIWTTVAAVMTLAIYSFLYKDNPFYKFAEHLLVGTSVGYSLILAYSIVFKPRVIDALLSPDMSIGMKILRVGLPALLGMCYLSYFTKKYTWVARYPIAFIMGMGSGLALPMTMLANVLRQLRGTFVEEVGGQLIPLISVARFKVLFAEPNLLNFMEAVYGPLLIIGVLSVMMLFIFSLEHTGPLKVTSKLGMIYLMLGFGAAFGYTVMARISLLVGRIDFLLGEWLGLL
ncbi:hypothetical protein JW905_16540 [bacterium]|nr:hypothetical protein [candidate division CSSED10-310 bacterium]